MSNIGNCIGYGPMADPPKEIRVQRVQGIHNNCFVEVDAPESTRYVLASVERESAVREVIRTLSGMMPYAQMNLRRIRIRLCAAFPELNEGDCDE